MIPEPLYGKEATLKEVLEGNEEKGYLPHPELLSENYKDLYNTAYKLEDLVSSQSVHAAGILISDFDIFEKVPLRTETKTQPDENGLPRKTQQYITQFDMDEVQELGLLKYDFLAIDNLSIIKETIRLLNEKGIKINAYEIPDFDERTYNLLAHGLMAGIFQMESSGVAKQLIAKIKPKSIQELSDISSINRPGPLSAGFDKAYYENKQNGYPPDTLPKCLIDITKNTYWTILYQEQIMKICSELAGFTLQESDEIRRAMGKKKKEVLEPWKNKFIENIVNNKHMTKHQAEDFWAEMLGYSDYVFNASHSVN